MLSGIKIGIAGKVLGLCVLLVTLSGGAAGVYFVGKQARFFHEEFEKRARVLMQSTATASEFHVLTGNREALALTAQKVLRQDNVAFLRILSADGAELFNGSNIRKGQVSEYSAPILTGKTVSLEALRTGAARPEPQRIGTVVLGVSLEEMRANVADMERTAVLFLLVLILVSLLLVRGLVRRIIQDPVDELMRGLRQIASGDLSHQVMVPSADELGRLADAFNRMISDLKKITVSRDHVDSIIESMTDALIVTDVNGRITTANRAAKSLWPSVDLIGLPAARLVSDSHLLNPGSLEKAGAPLQNAETSAVTVKGAVPVLVSGAVLSEHDGKISGVVALFKDITERKQSENDIREANQVLARNEVRLTMMLEESRRMQKELVDARDKLVHSEKMASLGQLSAGIAHEINNPLGFVMSNVQTLRGYLQVYDRMIDGAEKAVQDLRSGMAPERVADDLESVAARAGLKMLREDITPLLADVDDGLTRVKKIVVDLKGFVHMDQDDMGHRDIHAILESAIAIAWNMIKYKADLRRNFADVPEIMCNEYRLGQIFVNLLVNAAQAIETGHGEIRISTGVDMLKGRKCAVVRIADTGNGIPPENMKKIFDPFFSTKPVGHGTGLGLSISYDIVKQHEGEIVVTSELGKGTVVSVFLPVDGVENRAVV